MKSGEEINMIIVVNQNEKARKNNALKKSEVGYTGKSK